MQIIARSLYSHLVQVPDILYVLNVELLLICLEVLLNIDIYIVYVIEVVMIDVLILDLLSFNFFIALKQDIVYANVSSNIGNWLLSSRPHLVKVFLILTGDPSLIIENIPVKDQSFVAVVLALTFFDIHERHESDLMIIQELLLVLNAYHPVLVTRINIYARIVDLVALALMIEVAH